MVVRVSQSYANLLAPGTASATVFRSLPFRVPSAAHAVTLVLVGSENGTLDVEALFADGDEGTATDWYVYNTAADQVTVTADEPARFTIVGAPPILRLLYTPVSSATVSHACGNYTGAE